MAAGASCGASRTAGDGPARLAKPEGPARDGAGACCWPADGVAARPTAPEREARPEGPASGAGSVCCWAPEREARPEGPASGAGSVCCWASAECEVSGGGRATPEGEKGALWDGAADGPAAVESVGPGWRVEVRWRR